MKQSVFTLYFFVFICPLVYPQSEIPSDSLTQILFPDTLSDRKLVSDSAKTPGQQAADDGVDTVICYGADSTEGFLESSVVILKNNAWVRYKGIEIKAAKIMIDQPNRKMTAEAVPDSMDSSRTVLSWKGKPVFSEGGESFIGQVMEYNFDTKRGKVTLGETKMQDGIYYGQTIRKIGDSTLYVRKGKFTSCDDHHPHYYFHTEQMKMEMRDKVVAKPVILYIHEVPVFAIPFGVFPNQTGRRSGIVPPTYNETPREGRQLRNFGYYWAPNDYFDALTQMDYLDKAGYQFREGIRYAKRYSFSGSFQFSYSSLSYITGEKNRLWSVDATHSQTISERSNLNADIHYINTKSFYQFTSINRDQVLNRQVRSNASYNNSYDWGSVSASLSQSKNLDNGQREFTFPNVSVSKSSAPVFSKPEKDRDQPDTWYQTIRYSYSSNALRRETQSNDTAVVLSAIGMNHNGSLSAPFKIMKYFNLSPNFSVQETWFDRRRENYRYDSLNRLISDTVRGFFARHTFSTSVSMSTKIYGMMNPDVFGLKTFRHVMTPSMSLTYQPDFSEKQWGYWESVRDTGGVIRKYDRYTGNILFGGSPSGRALSLGVSLGNVFQAKFLTSGNDSGKTSSGQPSSNEKKMDLMNWNSSISYNFEAEEFKLSNLSTNLSISNDLAKNVSLSMNMVHDFYRWDTTRNTRINKLNIIPRLISANITAGFSLQGGESTASQRAGETESTAQTAAPTPGSQFVPSNTSLPDGVPWDVRFNFNYDISKYNPKVVTKQFGVNITAGMKITQNWQVSYNARYDILKKDMVSQSFSFIRDLHCWEMRLDWTPVGPTAGYFFIVQIKAANLRDVKIQRTDYGSRTFY